MNFLCVDIGTTSIKVGIISDLGEVVSFLSKKFDSSHNNFISELWLTEFYSICSIFDLKKNKISSICVSGNGPTICAQNGKTLLWNENVEFSEKIKTSSIFIPKILAFKEKFPDDFNNSEFIYSGPEFFIYKLTHQSVSILPEKRFLPAYWTPEELQKFNLPEKKIPEFVKTTEIVGNLSENVKNLLKIDYDVPVIAGGPDFVAALIGTNTLSSGKICDRAGSSEGINLCSKIPVFSDKIRTLPSVVPGLWNLSVIIEKSGSLIDEFKKQIEKIENRKISYEEIIDFCFEDKNSEGWRLLSEIEEKNLLAVKILSEIAKNNNLDFENLMTITGGQAENQKWLTKKAVGIKINIAQPEFIHSELLGDAVISSVALKKYKNLQEAAEKICKIHKIFNSKIDNSSKMKIYKIPKKLKTIIFDIDSTLYTNSKYAFEQVDVQIRQIAKEKNILPSDLRNQISEFRKNWKETHNGQKISLGNTFINLGIPIEKSIQMRKELLEPGNFLKPDLILQNVLSSLKKKYNLICVTNNPVLPAKKTLSALGIDSFISEIIGLDTCKKSKPAFEPFELAAKITDSSFEECLSVGDRFDMDISLPLKMGMGGILVSGVEDVYRIEEILKNNS